MRRCGIAGLGLDDTLSCLQLECTYIASRAFRIIWRPPHTRARPLAPKSRMGNFRIIEISVMNLQDLDS